MDLLQTPVSVEGTVTGGNKLGRRLGFPTANIAADNTLEAADGVYAARVLYDGQTYDAMANLGVKPSVSGSGKRVLEVNLFDFDGNLYGKTITVTLLAFVRPERRFASFDGLHDAIAGDKEQIIKILNDL